MDLPFSRLSLLHPIFQRALTEIFLKCRSHHVPLGSSVNSIVWHFRSFTCCFPPYSLWPSPLISCLLAFALAVLPPHLSHRETSAFFNTQLNCYLPQEALPDPHNYHGHRFICIYYFPTWCIDHFTPSLHPWNLAQSLAQSND